ncbi:MAG: heme ABC exporter ATP-binding protein CcmA [Pseudomonadota bacterium]
MRPLALRDLRIGRVDRPLLDDVTFEVPAGGALALQGPNGLGKTTLLRTLAGLMPPLSGAVSHDTEDVAYAAHLDALKPALSVRESLAFWADLYGTAQVDAALAAFNLQALADRPCAMLSAGQRRRCALARLVVSGRSIWLLDEPTAALDAQGQAELADVLKAHSARGGIALLVTHAPLPIPCETLELTPFRAKPDLTGNAFGEALA